MRVLLGHGERGDEGEVLVRLEQTLLFFDGFGRDSLAQRSESLVLIFAEETSQSGRLSVVLGVEVRALLIECVLLPVLLVGA